MNCCFLGRMMTPLLVLLGGFAGYWLCHGAPTHATARPEAADTKPGRDWPQFGGTPQRNLVDLVDRNIPTEWNVKQSAQKNIKWIAELGSVSYGGPVVADGKVFV